MEAQLMAKKQKATKKTAAKKTKAAAPAKKAAVAAPKKAPAQIVKASTVTKPAEKARTKTDIVGVLADCTGLSKKEVGFVFESLVDLIGLDMGKKGPGIFSIPGLMKIIRHNKPATKARKGVNPFTNEPMTFKAKPARNVVKVRALKQLKEMVA
jgi:nucleoid DNA-binding protein